MSLLLDTHVLLWLLGGEAGRFGPQALGALRDRASLVSAVTVWEITIKRRVGKLKAPAYLVETVASAGLQFLSITARHAEHVGELPNLHRDPFDRLLVSQAILDNLMIVTADSALQRYAVATLDVAS